ncbi:MAG: arsenite methyltransferase [Thermoproteota archaeon]|nr:arsenite methyltransferase [Thermoproteota archaeon]
MQKNDDEIKETIRKRYGTIALQGNSDSCCMPSSSSSISSSLSACCSSGKDAIESAKSIGYQTKELASIPPASVLGVGCGNPIKFAHIQEGDTVVDLGSGAGIDVFLAANIARDKGKVIGVDMTDEMLQKAKENAQRHGYNNVEFRKGDIEKALPVEDNSADAVISNCVINLTSNKVNTFKEIYRVLKPGGLGKMVISDLVTSKEVDESTLDKDNWCSCIDGALTKEHYIDSIKQAGFNSVEVLDETPYLEIGDDEANGRRKITSITIKAIKE